MKAARLHEYNRPLRLDDLPVPEPGGGEVIVQIAASGLCHSDLHIIDGELRALPRLPLTLGHENAGYVEATGPEVTGLARGDAVVVYGGWGCGVCRFCRQGEEQLCGVTRWVGIGVDGGYADYLRVPARRHLIKLSGLDPVEAASFTDAGLTPYRAIKKTLPYLFPGALLVIIGVGGLGHFAVQIAKAIAPGARIVAVDVDERKLRLAAQLGADEVLDARGEASAEIKRLSDGEGAQAVIDLVGSDSSLKTALSIVGRQSIVVLVGLAGGSVPFSYMGTPSECTVTSSQWGSFLELQEVLALGAAGKVRPHIQRFPLSEINDAFHQLKEGRIEGRAVIIP